MTTRRTLHLPALLGTLAAAVLVACALALLAVSGEAGASFPGKNGRIAYNSGGVIYTINSDGSAKTKVTNTHVSGYPIDYSPSGKMITYTSYEGFNDGKETRPQKDAEIYTINPDATKSRVPRTPQVCIEWTTLRAATIKECALTTLDTRGSNSLTPRLLSRLLS
jgi:hypothetical protein